MVGEIGADLVGIDILERDGARAVDELTLELPAGYDPDDLVFALSQIAGVEVEDLRPTSSLVPPLPVATRSMSQCLLSSRPELMSLPRR